MMNNGQKNNSRKRSAADSENMNTPKRWNGFDGVDGQIAQNGPEQVLQQFAADPTFFMFPQQAFNEYQAFFQTQHSTPNQPQLPVLPEHITPPYAAYNMTPSTGSNVSYNTSVSADSSGYQSMPEMSPEEKENEPPVNEDDKSGNEVIEKVPGRLALVGNLTKYDVTVDEIRRRVNMPECMNSSSLGGLLRRAKVKSGGTDMREQLKQHGIDVPVCKRKGCATTTFTCLTEGESIAMAKDMDHITGVSYPVYPLACNVLSRLAASGIDAQTAQRDLQGFVTTMQTLSSILNEVTPPVANTKPRFSVDPNLNQGMTNFSLQTHGFGVENQRTWTRMFTNVATQAIKLTLNW